MSKKILSTTLILLALVLTTKGVATAKTNWSPNFGEDVTVAKNEVVAGPYLKMGNNITISGTVNGDVYLLGSIVTIDGTIKGDLIVGGGVVTIKGEVTDDIRAVGGMVTIDGKVGKNVTAVGGTVALGSDADVDGDLLTACGNLAHLGNIDGNVLARADEATFAGRVGGNIQTTAEKVSVPKTAILDGDMLYQSDKEASVSAEARIIGTVKRTPTGRTLTQVVPQAKGVLLRFRLLSYFSMLLVGLILLKIAPRQVTAVSKLIGEQPWRCLGLGLLTLVLVPVVAVILAITIIGVPLAAILVGVYILMLTLSSIFAGLFVGQKIFDLANFKENRYAMLAVGLLLLQLVFAVPVVGGLVRLLSLLAAVGAMVTLKREALRRLEVKLE